MAYGTYHNLARRTVFDKELGDKIFEIASNPKRDRYQRWIALIIYKICDKVNLVKVE